MAEGFDRELDIRGEVCPYTFVKTKSGRPSSDGRPDFAPRVQRTNEIFPATIRNKQPNTLTFRNNINARTNR